MAVMLRTLGVPARVVNGFQRGEWNPYGQYYIVRYYDAHSWVEAFIPGVGWVTFDPTPRATVDARAAGRPDAPLPRLPPAPVAPLRGELDAARPDPRRPVDAVQAGRPRSWSAGLDAETRAQLGRTGSLALVGLIGGVGAWAAWHHRRGGIRRGAEPDSRLLPARPPNRRAAGTPAGGRRDRAGVQRPRRRPRAGSGLGVHPRDGAVRARPLRRNAAGRRRDRGSGGCARRHRTQVALTADRRLSRGSADHRVRLAAPPALRVC